MARINTSGQLSVGNTAGAGQSVNQLTGIGNVETNITTREFNYMGGNPANRNAAGAVCMPNQAEKIIDLTNLTGSAYRYSGTPSSDAWKRTAVSEFRGAYTTIPTIATSTANSGNFNYGNCTITCTPPSDIGGICSVYITPTPSLGVAGWVSCNSLNQYTFRASRNVTYTIYVKDIFNCGANLEFSRVGVFYP